MTIETSIYAYARQSLERFPDKVAIWYNDEGITYRELFEKIDNVADHLYEMGVREGTVVTIHLSNCPEAIIAIYAVAKLGGICSMVHELIPKDAVKSYLSFTESDYIITRRPFHSGAKCEIVLTDFEFLCIPADIRTPILNQNDMAEKCAVYVQSSGTDGVPKTVMVSHRALNAYQENTLPHFDSPRSEIVGLAVAPYFHLLGISGDVHRTISSGAQMVIMKKWDCEEAMPLVSKYHVSLLSGVPKMYADLLANTRFSKEYAPQIAYCFMGGDTIPQSLIDEVDKRFDNRVSCPVYGMTELGCGACAMTRVYYKRDATGYPLKNTSFCLEYPDGTIRYSGEGELLCSSENMMMGYLKNPNATKRAFTYFDHRKWVRTGDYGRIDADGYVYFLCRVKNIIIHNGYNVFPDDVVKVIRCVPEVSDVVVFGKDNSNGSEDVIAAIVLKKRADDAIIQESVKLACIKSLPRFAIPQKILVLTEFPRNTMGKVDIQKLKEFSEKPL